MLKSVGFFMPGKENYIKKALSVKEQIKLLESRGMIIDDCYKAELFLTFVNYYRFSAYTLHYEIPSTDGVRSHSFPPGVKLSTIINLYEFDHKLRLHFTKALESIEIAFRTVLCHHMSLKYGSHWYEDKNLFFDSSHHKEFLNRLKYEISKKDSEAFIKHYSDKYATPKRPPAWMIIEIISLGASSKLYNNLNFRKDQKSISRQFNIPFDVCGSWMHSLTTLRNTCAHHSRLWNRHFAFTPAIPNSLRQEWNNTDKLYDHIWIIKELLKVIHRDSGWLKNLKFMLMEERAIDKSKMGFSDLWNSNQIWDD